MRKQTTDKVKENVKGVRMENKDIKDSCPKNLEEAVNGTPDVNGWYCAGLGALTKGNKEHISANGAKGSVDIDTAMKRIDPNGNRWDYAIECDGEIHYVEVHGAERTSRKDEVEKKLEWLHDWLKKHSLINGIQQPKRFHWVATGEIDIREVTPASKQKKKAGLIPKKYLIIGN